MNRTITRLIFFWSFLFTSATAYSQMVYMPDSNLRAKLTSLGYGSCITGNYIDSQCPLLPNLTYLDFSNYGVHSLEGIDVFTALRKIVCQNYYYSINYLSVPALPASLDTLILNYCFMQSLPTLPSGIVVLDVSNDSLPTLPSLPPSLIQFSCSNNSLQFLPQLPSTVKSIFCSYNQLSLLPSPLPPQLVWLVCDNNQIQFLPTLPSTVVDLYCQYNQLTSIPALPASLDRLDCGYNNLYSLPTLPSGLSSLICKFNHITTFPTLPTSLHQFNCSSNQITSLPPLPSGLLELYSTLNPITSLPATLPPGLQIFYCVDNQLTSLPALPSTLVDLWCSQNQLTTIPSLPAGMYRFCCEHNQLTSIPALPSSLNELNCSSNQITALPPFPPFLYRINCDTNQLSALPELPDSVKTLSLNFNPSLTCLPALKKIGWIYFSNCPILCVPNYPQHTWSTPYLTSLPLCGIFNPNGCNFYWNISGHAFFDPDYTCTQSSNESDMRNLHVNLYRNNVLDQQVFTNHQGNYSFDTDSLGIYTVELDTVGFPFISNCPASNNYLDTLTVSDSLEYDNNFSVRCNGIDLGAWSVVSEVFRPSHLSIVSIRAGDLTANYGVHCASGLSGTVTVTINGNAHYYANSSSAMAPNVSGNMITYSISNFANLDPFTAINFILETDTLATAGSSICLDVSVSILPGDINHANNNLTQCFLVHASLDPNDKEVYPGGAIDSSQHELTYTIRFQNTGSAPADNIYILDTLDQNLDISTFQLLSTSHDAFVQILPGNIVRFNFPLINLPDSFSNEPMSHGFAQYKIKIKSNLPLGTQINNTAYIYFDFNAPVVTNTTSNTINLTTGTKNNDESKKIIIYPMPFRNEFVIEGEIAGSTYRVYDILGNEIAYDKFSDVRQFIHTESWSNGVYFLRIENKDSVIVRKLIKKN